MIIVSNTTPLSELSKIGRLELLRDIYQEIIISQEVYSELLTGNHPAVIAVKSASWIKVHNVSNYQLIQQLQLETGLDLGESSAIILAEELKADQLLIDEKLGRKIAQARGLPILGLVAIIVLTKEQGLINSVKDILDALMSNGTRISNTLYEYALRRAHE
jgi:predicted nucleic acid-binding protein